VVSFITLIKNYTTISIENTQLYLLMCFILTSDYTPSHCNRYSGNVGGVTHKSNVITYSGNKGYLYPSWFIQLSELVIQNNYTLTPGRSLVDSVYQ